MSVVLEGTPAAEGIATGPIHCVSWGVPDVPHAMVEPGRVDDEVERFHEARAWAKDRLREIQATTQDRLGAVEARIFEPQILMVDDVEVVDGTVRYIRENHLTAQRAFEWRILELQAQWSRTSQPMVLDRLNDLEDLMIRVLHRLLGQDDPSDLARAEGRVIMVASNLTPSLAVHLDPEHVLGVATDQGTRTAHWAMLARALGIPAVVGLGSVTRQARHGMDAILDGRSGRVVLEPTDDDRAIYERRQVRLRAWEAEKAVIAEQEPVTADGHPVALRVNLDLPLEAEAARTHGADGVGLFRTEFLVVGRSTMPDEEEQFEAYRSVAEAFQGHAIYLRTFDIGGDKFPLFLPMPREENPFLGWRAIRVCLDRPELFRPQLRAILRATAFGDIRIMLPLVNDVEEVQRVRALLAEEEASLEAQGVAFNRGYKLGVMIETPAAALDAVELARHCDFFSIGTNDLVQYTLAVDRTNTRLAHLYNPFHPAVVRQLHQVSRVARAADIEVGVCGEMASTPLGAFLMLGLDITSLSMPWPSLPEIKGFIREIRIEDARAAARKALAAPTSADVIRCLEDAVGGQVDLRLFSGRWRLSGGG